METGFQRVVQVLLSGWLPVVMSACAVWVAALSSNGTWIDATRSHIPHLVLIIVLSGVGAMTIVELIKRLLPLRARFQHKHLRLLITDEYLVDRRSGHAPRGLLIEAMESLELRRGGATRVDSTFNLPPEQLIAQLSNAIDAELATRWNPVPPSGAEARTHMDEIAEVRSAVTRTLDDLLIRLSLRWRHYLQATSMWLAAWVAYVLTEFGDLDVQPVPAVVGALLCGGAIAWTARDIAAGVESWRH